MNGTEERRAARKRFQAQYRALYDEVLEILFQIDPIGVHGQDNTEKFVPEATTILARLREARFAAGRRNDRPPGAATVVRSSATRPRRPPAAHSCHDRHLLG